MTAKRQRARVVSDGDRAARRVGGGGDAAARPVPNPLAGPPSAAQLLALQRAVGNAAVVSLMQERSRERGAAQEVERIVRTPGRALASAVRTEMQERLAADFSDVRVHTGSAAQRSAELLGARAYTTGNHVVLGRDGTDDHTLAHELTHVLQQRRGPVAGQDNGAGLRVSDPSDRFEREAERNAAAVMRRPNAPGRTTQASAVSHGSGTAVQRNIGLELEHSVPVYANTPGKTQEQNLRQDSYDYNNAVIIYSKGVIAVKVDHSKYSELLFDHLKTHNPQNIETRAGKKGISILEYTTAGKGINEFEPGAYGKLVAHVAAVNKQITKNEAGVVGGTYYTGLPAPMSRNDVAGYGTVFLQVTHGVFPSRLDLLHRTLFDEPHYQQYVVGDSRVVHGDIAKILSLTAKARTTIAKEIISATGHDEEFWDKDEENSWVKSKTRAAALHSVAVPTLDSLFRFALSYYLGARIPLSRETIEKNAVPLLLRSDLGTMFQTAGIKPLFVWKDILVPRLTKLLKIHRDFIDSVVEQTMAESTGVNYAGSPHQGVLPGPRMSPADIMIAMLNGDVVGQITPGATLSEPDEMPVAEVSADAEHDYSTPEQGGTQVEYRHINAVKGHWHNDFLEIARLSFALGVLHLPEHTQISMAKDAGWDVESVMKILSRQQDAARSDTGAASAGPSQVKTGGGKQQGRRKKAQKERKKKEKSEKKGQGPRRKKDGKGA